MTNQPLSDDREFDIQLRTTLRVHTSTIDVDTAWNDARRQLYPITPNASLSSRISPFLVPAQRSKWWPKPALAVVAIMALILMGTGVVTATSFWLGEHQYIIGTQGTGYQTIGQQQVSQGVKITLVKAYADEGRTYVQYTIQLPSGFSTSKQVPIVYPGATSLKTGQESVSPEIQTICETDCGLRYAPFHPSANTHSLDVTWNITAIQIPSAHGTVLLAGHWSFHFTLPFHQQNHDPGYPLK